MELLHDHLVLLRDHLNLIIFFKIYNQTQNLKISSGDANDGNDYVEEGDDDGDDEKGDINHDHKFYHQQVANASNMLSQTLKPSITCLYTLLY